MAGFCTNSNRWLDFLYKNPKSCPYDYTHCDIGKCGYYQERKPSAWYIERMKALRFFSNIGEEEINE